MTRSFLIASFFGFLGGILCRSFLFLSWPSLAFVALLAVICVFANLVKPRAQYLLAVFVCVGLSLGLLRTAFVPTVSEELSKRFDTNVELSGKVVASPDVRETNQRITVAVETGDKIIVVAPLEVMIRRGERVAIEGEVSRPEPFDTEGGREFRYDQFLAKDGVFGVMQKGSVKVTGSRESVGDYFLGALDDIKRTFILGLSTALPEPHASLAGGMLFGGKQGLGKELLDVFTSIGLIHIVVLSGYNIMVIAEAILRSLTLLSKRTAVIWSVLGIIAFVLAAGAGAAAVRAGIMACIGLYARSSGRTYNALMALGVAVTAMLAVNPLLLVFDPGFQLSILATLGLITFAPKVEPLLAVVRSSLLREVVSSTIAAQVFVLPLLLYQSGNLSIYALPANVLVLPVVPLAMALSFASSVIGLIVPAASMFSGLPAYVVLGYVIGVAEFLASLPFAKAFIPSFPITIVICAYAILTLSVLRNKGITQRN